MRFADQILITTVFSEMIDSIQEDHLRLVAGLFSQGVHLASDKYTKLGLPVPFLGALSENLAKTLYHNQYDALCFQEDIRKVSISAFVAILINDIIKIVHGFFYNEKQDFSRELYQVRTRKILLISNSIATSSNLISCAILKNPKLIDIGGILVTISRLFSDIKFICKIKEEFISNALDERLNTELIKIDQMYNEIVMRNKL